MRRNDCRLRFGYDWNEERRRSRGASEGNPPQRLKGNRRFSPTSENAAQVRAEKHRRNECRDWHERRMVYAVAAKSPARLSENSGSHVTESGGVATTVGMPLPRPANWPSKRGGRIGRRMERPISCGGVCTRLKPSSPQSSCRSHGFRLRGGIGDGERLPSHHSKEGLRLRLRVSRIKWQ